MKFIESIKIIDNKLYNIEYHIARMKQSSRTILPDLISINTIKKGKVKCRIVYDANTILSIEFLPYKLPQISSLEIVKDDNINYAAKYYDRTELDCLYQQRKDADDIIICKNGLVTDSYFCNLVFKRDNKLYTPNSPLLKGTKRQFLIEKSIIEVDEISIQNLHKYDGVFLINAMIELEDKIYIEL